MSRYLQKRKFDTNRFGLPGITRTPNFHSFQSRLYNVHHSFRFENHFPHALLFKIKNAP